MQQHDIDWSRWQPKDRATLVFVQQDNRVLLIRKQRGLGKGYLTGPGGRHEPGETAEMCAIREVYEELRIHVEQLQAVGELAFQFTDGYTLAVDLFTTRHYSGEPQTTAEAVPVWCDRDNLPLQEMWADDGLWLPMILAGVPIEGRFIFDDIHMTWFAIKASATQKQNKHKDSHHPL